jgi:hypothetical protein
MALAAESSQSPGSGKEPAAGVWNTAHFGFEGPEPSGGFRICRGPGEYSPQVKQEELDFVQRTLAEVLNEVDDPAAASLKTIQTRLQESLRSRTWSRAAEVKVEIRPTNFSFHDRNAKVIKAEVERGGEEYYLAMTYPEDLVLQEAPDLSVR